MTKKQAVKYYGTEQAIADALGISRQAVNQWPAIIPLKSQFLLELDTNGKLKADRSARVKA